MLTRTSIQFRLASLATLLVLPAACTDCSDTSLQKTTPLITPSSSEVDFGEVVLGASRVREVRVQSSGNGTLQIHAVTLDGDAAFQLEQRVDSAALNPGEGLNLRVVFRPSGIGSVTAALVVTNNSDNTPALRINLQGAGIAVPTCDDGNECTDDSFDLVAGICRQVNNLNPCSTGSKCTQDDRCVGGQCRGLATTCQDTNACTRDLCDPAFGCVFVPVQCDDANSCTLDTCDPALGCAHRALPNGAPCEDGNLCSVGDQCESGECRGGLSTQEPAQLGVAHGYGSGGRGVPLKDGRILFLDPVYLGGGEVLTRATVVTLLEERLVHQKTVDLPAIRVFVPAEVMDNGVVAVVSEDSSPRRIKLLTVDAGGTVEEAGSTDPVAASPRQFTHLGNVLYGLATIQGDSVVVMVDATNPAAPVLVTQSLAGEFVDLAVDTQRQLLLVVGETGLTRFSLANPVVPVFQDIQLPGQQPYLVATNGEVTVTVHRGQGTLDIRSAETGGLLRSIVFGVPDGPSAPFSLALGAGHLWVATADFRVTVYGAGLTGDTAPQGSMEESTHRFEALKIGGLERTVVTAGSAVFSLGGAPGYLTRVTGAGHGTLAFLHNDDGALISASEDGVHQLDLTHPAQPRFVAGASLPQRAALISLNSLLRTPTLLVGHGAGAPGNPDVSTIDSNVWVDASDLNHPVARASVLFPRLEASHAFMRSDGRRMYMAQSSLQPDHPLLFAVLNPDNGTGSGAVELPLGTALSIPSGVFGYPNPGYMAKDPESSRVVVSVQQRTGSEQRSQVTVVDTQDSEALSVLTSFTTAYLAGGVAMAGPLIAVLETSAGQNQAGKVHIYRMDNAGVSAPELLGSLDVEGPRHLLLMDAHVLLIATNTGVAYANVFSDPPVLLGQVATPDGKPTSALIQNENLVLAFPGSVMVLSPPCPLPP